MSKVYPMRRRSSGTLTMFENPPATAIVSSIFSAGRCGGLFARGGVGDDDRRTLGAGDLLRRAGAETVRMHGQLLGELALAEDLHPDVATLYQPRVTERLDVDRGSVVEALELRDVHHRGGDGERHAEAALGETALDRSLAALEVRLVEVAGLPGLLALHALAARLA